MKLQIVFLVASVFCFTKVIAQKSNVTPATQAQAENGKKELVRLKETIKRFDEALLMNNAEELKRVLSDKFEIIHSNGMTETKTTLLQHLKEGKLQYHTIVPGENYKTAMTGTKEAVVTRDLEVAGVLDDQDFKVQLTTVEKWVSESGDWKLLKRESKNR